MRFSQASTHTAAFASYCAPPRAHTLPSQSSLQITSLIVSLSSAGSKLQLVLVQRGLWSLRTLSYILKTRFPFASSPVLSPSHIFVQILKDIHNMCFVAFSFFFTGSSFTQKCYMLFTKLLYVRNTRTKFRNQVQNEEFTITAAHACCRADTSIIASRSDNCLFSRRLQTNSSCARKVSNNCLLAMVSLPPPLLCLRLRTVHSSYNYITQCLSV